MNRFIEIIAGINPKSNDPLMPSGGGRPALTAQDIMSALAGEDRDWATFIVAIAQDGVVPADVEQRLRSQVMAFYIHEKERAARYFRNGGIDKEQAARAARLAMDIVKSQRQVDNLRSLWAKSYGQMSNYQFAKVEPVILLMVRWFDDNVSSICHNAYQRVGFYEVD